MATVVMDQRFLGGNGSFLDGVELLCDVETGTLPFDHVDNCEDGLGAIEAFGATVVVSWAAGCFIGA